MEQKTLRNSTVAISPDDTKRLNKFCKNNNITKKDFISLSLSYFETQGVNPAKHETPRAEMEKVTKRLDQFFAFMKKQEQDILKPMYNDFIQSNKKVNISLSSIVDYQQTLNQSHNKSIKDTIEGVKLILKHVESAIQKENSNIQEVNKLNQADNKKLQQGILELCKFLDEKNKRGLFDKIKDSF